MSRAGRVSCGSVLFDDSPNYHCDSPLRERGVVVLLLVTMGLGVVGLAARSNELAAIACVALGLLVLAGGARTVLAGDNRCGPVFTGGSRGSPCAEEMRDQTTLTIAPALALLAVGAQRVVRRIRLRSALVVQDQRVV